MDNENNLILIVDDNSENLQILGNIMRRKKYAIAVATNGFEVLSFVEKKIPDLILLDVMMPILDGIEVCKRLKANERTKDIPVIFITALDDISDKIKGFEAGGVDFISKPFQKEEVYARVNIHLELKNTQERLKKFSIALEQCANSIIITDKEMTIVYVNAFFTRTTGYLSQEVIGKNYYYFLKEINNTEEDISFLDIATIGNEWKKEVSGTNKSGELFWEFISISPVRDSIGEITNFIAICEDITQRKIFENKLEYLSITDELTGTYNRRFAFEILNKVMISSKRNSDSVTICFIDIDNLKKTNDVLGHKKGDELIISIVNEIKENIRGSDYLCRMGGDEFLLILPECTAIEAEKLIIRVKENIKGYESSIGIELDFSYGFAEYSSNMDINIDKIIEKADMNMYEQKRGKRNEVCAV